MHEPARAERRTAWKAGMTREVWKRDAEGQVAEMDTERQKQ
jgi:hypothetical protein